MSTIHERLTHLVENLARGNQSEFARSVGISQPTLATYLQRSEPGFAILNKIITAYPELSADWLLTGKGGMFKEKISQQAIAGRDATQAGRDVKINGKDTALLEQEVRFLKEKLNDKEHIISLLMKH